MDQAFNTVFLASLVLPEGMLDDRRVTDREVLYRGRNGKQVERFSARTVDGATGSFIFKPLTNADTLGREAWAHRRLLPSLPTVRYPRLLANAEHKDAERYWSIYEDLGRLDHQMTRSSLMLGATAIPYWHELPLESVPPEYEGHTPLVDSILDRVERRWDELTLILNRLFMPSSWIQSLDDLLRKLNGTFPSEIVVSHGDYHSGNLAVREGELIVLDWEYVHRNSVFWDLYNLIDITDPKKRRAFPVDRQTRLAILEVYADRRAALGWSGSKDTLLRDYHVYAALYSAWILLLVENDLKAGSFDSASLIAQREETFSILSSCIAQTSIGG